MAYGLPGSTGPSFRSPRSGGHVIGKPPPLSA